MTPSGTPKAKPATENHVAASSPPPAGEPKDALASNTDAIAAAAERRAVVAEEKAAALQVEVDTLRAAADQAAKEAAAAKEIDVKSPRKGSKFTLVAIRAIGHGPNTERPRQGGAYQPGEEFQAHDEDAFERLQRTGAAATPGNYRKFKLEG